MIRTGQIRGNSALWLENELVSISILPQKGADIYELIYRPDGVDFIYKTLPGRQSPGKLPFMKMTDNYEGGWQELFPNTGDECQYQGISLPMHGEVHLMPWNYEIVRNDEIETSVLFSVETHLFPYRLERLMRIQRGLPIVVIEEQVTNLSKAPLDFVWGHHLMLGGNFLEGGCIYDAACHTLVVPDQPKAPENARFKPGQRHPWPMVRSRDSNELIDIRKIPGPEIHSHDDLYLTDLDSGKATVTNPNIGLAFTLTWDAAVFGCLVMWQPFGGLDTYPWTGSYGVGMEPWVTYSNLSTALEAGKSIRLGSNQSLATSLTATIQKS